MVKLKLSTLIRLSKKKTRKYTNNPFKLQVTEIKSHTYTVPPKPANFVQNIIISKRSSVLSKKQNKLYILFFYVLCGTRTETEY